MSDKLTFSITEAAKLLGISKSYAYEMAQARKFPVRQVGDRVLVPRKEFLAWFEAGIEMPEERKGLRIAR